MYQRQRPDVVYWWFYLEWVRFLAPIVYWVVFAIVMALLFIVNAFFGTSGIFDLAVFCIVAVPTLLLLMIARWLFRAVSPKPQKAPRMAPRGVGRVEPRLYR